MSPQLRRWTLIPWRQAPGHDNATHQPSTPQRPHPLHLTNNVKRNGISRQSRYRRLLHQRPRIRTNPHLNPRTGAPTARHDNPSRQLHRQRICQRYHQAKMTESDRLALLLDTQPHKPRSVPHILAARHHQPGRLSNQALFTGAPSVNAMGVPEHIRRVSAMRHCAHSARVCQFPCYQNCETQNLFAKNMPETID